MLRSLLLAAALAACIPAADVISQTVSTERAVAITFDDLPATGAGMVRNDPASLREMTRKLLATVREHNVPAVARGGP